MIKKKIQQELISRQRITTIQKPKLACLYSVLVLYLHIKRLNLKACIPQSDQVCIKVGFTADINYKTTLFC